MKNLNLKPFTYIFAFISAIAFFCAARIQKYDLSDFFDLLKLVPFVVSADLLAYFIFRTWIWRWNILQGWLVPFPDLNGTWQGWLQTTWKDDHGNIPGPIPVILTIKQSFTQISCSMRTAEMVSHSFLEGFCIDRENQIRRLCYSYTSKPKTTLRDRSTPHDGTILLDIIGKPVSKLEGEYWTERKTTGTVTLSFRIINLLDELPPDIPPHPMANSH